MSANKTSTPVEPPASRDAGSEGSEVPGEPQADAEPAAAPHFHLDTAELANLLAHGLWPDSPDDMSGGSVADAQGYDGHVALVLDTGILPALDSTLDLLTSSHDLSDVPALDLGSGASDGPAG